MLNFPFGTYFLPVEANFFLNNDAFNWSEFVRDKFDGMVLITRSSVVFHFDT